MFAHKKIHPGIIMPILLTDFDFMLPNPSQTGPSLAQNFHEIITPKKTINATDLRD